MDNPKGIEKQMHSTQALAKGKNYVLAIGIDDYTHHRSLRNAVADANAFVEVMTSRYGFEHLTPPLYNKEATQRNIRKALGKCESLGEHDRLIVFYSGHGWFKTSANLGYLVPSEADDDPNSDFIPINFITDIFRAVKARHVLLVVDCCFGGSFGLERNISVAMTEKKISILDTKRSRMVLSSGGIELVSDGLVADNNSPFTKPLIEILKENQAPQMAFSEFFNLLCKKTIWNANQVPQYKVLQHLGHADGELALYCNDLESPEERDYKKAIEMESIPLLEKFIKDYPKSEYKPAVRKLLNNKRAEFDWEKIKNSRHIEKFDEFIEDYPHSPLADLAQRKIDDLGKTKELQKPVLPFEPKMVFVKGGAFDREYTFEKSVMFGLSKATKKGIQKITLSDFLIGKYPITQAQWRAVMGNNPSHFVGNDNCPVETVSWEDCHEFINKLNKKTSKKYRLPTETEWEFAARGGDKSKDNEYSGSHNIDEVAWFIGNSDGKTHPIGTKKANELGIYDMSGNVWEWCSDLNGGRSYDNSPVSKPKNAAQDSPHVMRGGSWHSDAHRCRVAVRSAPTERNNRLGFRVVLSS